MSTNTVSSHAEASPAHAEPSPLSDSGQQATALAVAAAVVPRAEDPGEPTKSGRSLVFGMENDLLQVGGSSGR
jgi:hypothetical protein